MTFFTIGLGGFFGAVMRYFISRKMNEAKQIPIGTLVVNMIGAFLIGVVLGAELPRLWTLLLALGFAGALTTFSTLNRELIELWQGGKRKEAVLYIFVTYCSGIWFAFTGYWIASKLYMLVG